MIESHRSPVSNPAQGRTLVLGLLVCGLALAGCSKANDDNQKKQDDSAKPGPVTPPAKTEVKPPPAADKPAAEVDYLEVQVPHKKPKPTDPVVVRFEGIKLVKAAFDPANLEGGTATIELDMTSLSSGIVKRDRHLKALDYFGVAKFATATIEVAKVTKSADGYVGTATVKMHGATVSVPVSFTVVGKTDKGVVVLAKASVSRTALGVGKSVDDPDESVADEVKVTLRMTLVPSS